MVICILNISVACGGCSCLWCYWRGLAGTSPHLFDRHLQCEAEILSHLQ